MSEESKPIAPGGASPVCEICGREQARGWADATPIDHATKCGRHLQVEDVGYDAAARFDGRCLRLGYERLRSSLSTAEKALRERDIAIRWALGEEALPDGRWFDPARFGHDPDGAKRVPPYWWRSILRLYSGIAEDAPTAPQASEIAADSSALEKALRALREGVALAQDFADFYRTHGGMRGDAWVRRANRADAFKARVAELFAAFRWSACRRAEGPN